ncbi:type II toxin-antitoxin system Phd/YefM family antitoxin [Dethiobacter alkaliphilus]|uniref:type II toxin-antitoxin system Phd/YefM family antitoxin n=1 Tax=Dethiobacter alkaliphilus TaxID=427926 RepID=UPI002225F149|nr:type II toxin-antitoxin system Phd/YefM family antitoxin [Dethiobacter alkaliphilus]MCW3488547.1 type II toxin-antitoxin system Phd/YefM family antitoxin [Dethiobacter alkaliphilus]
MPKIRPISDLRNSANEISAYCRSECEPVFITKNGVGDMVVMSIEVFEQQQALVKMYEQLLETETEIKSIEDFRSLAKKLKAGVQEKVQLK